MSWSLASFRWSDPLHTWPGTYGVYARYMEFGKRLYPPCTWPRPARLPSGYISLTRVPFGVPLLPRGLDKARAAERSWKLRAFAARRGTDLLAGRSRARGTKAGVRTLNGQRAGGGLRTRDLGAGEATSAHAPARPSWSWSAGSASTRPAGPAPGMRAESADTKLTARPTARARPLARRPGPPFP